MSEKVEKWYPGEGKLTTGRAILYVILVLGLISAVIRLFFTVKTASNRRGGALTALALFLLPV